MRILASGIACALMATSAQAASLTPHTSEPGVDVNTTSALVWTVKNDKPKNKPAKAKKPKPNKSKAKKPDTAPAARVKDDKKPGTSKQPKAQAKARPKAKPEKAAKIRPGKDKLRKQSEDVLRVRAPERQDMLRLLGATGLLLARPDQVIAEDDYLTYRNCPPGLAKKDPPCVPPGLAKKGVTYEEWAGYDEDRYERIWLDLRDDWLNSGITPDDLLLLQSDQIATLYGLDPAPAGQRYALIDGLPVLLDQEDYTSLLLVNELAQVTNLGSGVSVAPTAALTQLQLQQLYRLPPAAAGQNYAVLNGQLVQLEDSAYETLQLIRIARAVF